MAKNYQDIYNSVYVTGNKMDWTNAMIRGNGIPLDIYSVFDSYEDAVIFAATNAVAYEGQVLAVTENGDTIVYVITPALQGKITIDEVETNIYLKEVGKATLGDNKSIVLSDDGILSLKNFGVEYYAYTETEKEVEGGEKEIVVEYVKTTGWKDGLTPKVVKVVDEEGKESFEIAWYEPSTTTVEGLSDKIATIETKVNEFDTTKANKATTIEGYGITDAYTKIEVDDLLEDKAEKENTYTKEEVYTKTEVDDLLDDKADSATTLAGYGITDAYTKTEIDDIIDVIEEDILALETDKADKATTLEGYGITDAYKKSEVYNKEEIDGKLSGLFHFKGEVNYYNELIAIENPVEGDVYVVKYAGTEGEVALGAEYVYDGEKWIEFGSLIDLSGYATKAELADVDGKADDNAEAIAAINNESTGILKQAKDYADQKVGAHETATTQAIADAKAEAIEEAVADAKEYTDGREVEINKGVTANAEAISAINNETTGILANAKKYTDDREIEINKGITANAEAISAINNSETGVLANAKKYTDDREVEIRKDITANAEAITAINNSETGILANAKKYTDDREIEINKGVTANAEEIEKLKKADTDNLDAAKKHADDLNSAMDIRVKAITETIDSMNGETGILANAKKYTDDQLDAHKEAATKDIADAKSEAIKDAKDYTDAREVEINKGIAANTEAIAVINNETTGILKKAKDYTDQQINDHKTEANTAISTAKSEAIADANEYTDGKVTIINGELEKLAQADVTTLADAKAYTDQKVVAEIAASNAMIYRGTVGVGGTVEALPTTGVKNGDTYKVFVAGKYNGIDAMEGDMFIAVVTTVDEVVSIDWTYIPSGDDGNIYQGANFETNGVVIAKNNGTIETLGFGEAGQVLKSDGEDKLPIWTKETEYTVESNTDGLAIEKTVEEDGDVKFTATLNSVSTDILTQGTMTLILNGGNAAGVIASE